MGFNKRKNSKDIITIKSGNNIIKINIKDKLNKFNWYRIKNNNKMIHDYATIDVSKYNKFVDRNGINNEGNEVENKFS